MVYIFAQQPTINDPNADKQNLFGQKFIQSVETTYDRLFKQEFPDKNNPYVKRLLNIMTQVMERNRTLVTDKDITFKGLIPAIYAFQISEYSKARNLGLKIKFLNFKERTRNEFNVPDLWETRALTKINEQRNLTVLDKNVRYKGVSAYRLMNPVTMKPMCLSCHGSQEHNPLNIGRPKNEWTNIDKTGFEMEGWQLSDLGGGISVVLYDIE